MHDGTAIKDNGGRRSGNERRRIISIRHNPERRFGMERRSGIDRRVERYKNRIYIERRNLF